MKRILMLLLGAAALPVCLYSGEPADTTAVSGRENALELDEVVVVANRQVIRQEPDRIVYFTKNDPYAAGLDGVEVLDRIPRVSVVNDLVSVAGKSSVRYIVDGHLLDMTPESIVMKLRNLQASGIEKIELLTTPPARYAAADNVAYISITTRDETLGTRGNIWGRGSVREHFNYMAGGNISHSTRRVELSADASWNDYRGTNDLYRSYMFADGRERVSDRSSRFTWRTLSGNGMFRYKFNPRLSIGGIVNFSADPMKTDLRDVTIEGDERLYTPSRTSTKPDNSLTLTAFSDWTVDNSGRQLSLTYNFFDRHIHSDADVTTAGSDGDESRLTREGANKYRIHSVKFDATLPFSAFKLETGAAYTHVGNNTDLRIADYVDGEWADNPLQSNSFRYREHTAALYISGERNFTPRFFGKLGLRYEHTSVKGIQLTGNETHTHSYGYLFPSLNLSYNSPSAGRFSLDYSMGISRPQFNDLNPFRYYTTVKDYFTGNPDLDAGTVHNVGLNYSFRGIYAVMYGSWNRNAVGYITRFGADDMQVTYPLNCLNTMKTGLYASYSRALTSRWNLTFGGEVFYTDTRSRAEDFRDGDDHGWSGKLELNTSWMLNASRTLILNLRGTYWFPYRERMVSYRSRALASCEVRYMLLSGRLALSASVSDPFGWSITKSTTRYRDYTLRSRVDIHNSIFSFRAAWTFGRDKVGSVYRDTKERESGRSR